MHNALMLEKKLYFSFILKVQTKMKPFKSMHKTTRLTFWHLCAVVFSHSYR